MVLADVLGPFDLIVVLIVALLIFGGSKLPKVARSLGTATQEFKRGAQEGPKRTASEPPSPETPSSDDTSS